MKLYKTLVIFIGLFSGFSIQAGPVESLFKKPVDSTLVIKQKDEVVVELKPDYKPMAQILLAPVVKCTSRTLKKYEAMDAMWRGVRHDQLMKRQRLDLLRYQNAVHQFIVAQFNNLRTSNNPRLHQPSSKKYNY